jgi:2-phosphosulfolactate phosphatase
LQERSIEVCLTPALINLYDLTGKIVVVIDVLRATSSICVGLANGVKEIIPVSKVEECEAYRGKGYLLSAERDGSMVEGFDMGNSPYSYMGEEVNGKSVVMTTTNGTAALNLAKDAKEIIIGAFVNLDSVCKYLSEKSEDVVLLCAGWKNKFNLEDTAFAGAVYQKLKTEFTVFCDSCVGAETLYNLAKPNLLGFMKHSSHFKRLQRLKIERDVDYCLTPNQWAIVPIYNPKTGAIEKR